MTQRYAVMPPPLSNLFYISRIIAPDLHREATLMCLDSLRLTSIARNPHVGSNISGVKKSLKHTYICGLTERSRSPRSRDFMVHRVLGKNSDDLQHKELPLDTEAEVVEVSTPMAVSKITEVKYPDCDIYVESVILSGGLFALPFESYDLILELDRLSNLLYISRIIAPDLHPRESTKPTWGEWIHLKRGIVPWFGPIRLHGHRIMLCCGVGRLVDSQEGLETKTRVVCNVLLFTLSCGFGDLT
ncbi:hypothetical protein M9H77_03490 [Catharanthus roseus]|uniref:Uncharacterized protein n=1 Tax=Catharanthus roseus TaxID=4058 RepID=A0ACC0CBK6_CATRO|nr:hypothetical protein M9H77_03490 [Catharanthus roseus]